MADGVLQVAVVDAVPSESLAQSIEVVGVLELGRDARLGALEGAKLNWNETGTNVRCAGTVGDCRVSQKSMKN